MPVLIAPINVDLNVIKIMTDEKTKKHLENIGICVDGIVRVMSKGAGSVVLLVKGTRLALDSSLATKIFVKQEI